jgi:hypothetical protein
MPSSGGHDLCKLNRMARWVGLDCLVALAFLSGCGNGGSLDVGADSGSSPPPQQDGGVAESSPSDAQLVMDGQGGMDAGADADAANLDSSAPCRALDASATRTVSGTIAVQPGTPLGGVRAGMAGLSYEKSRLAAGMFQPNNAALIAMFRLLGPSILRVGGNSVDRSTWNGEDAGAPPSDAGTPANITPSDVDALAAFAKAAGWTVLYGVNMKASTPVIAAQEAAYAAGSLGSSLYGLEIGNEVDEYKSTLASPTTWSYATFRPQWEAFAAAIRAGGAGANVPLTGPASAWNYMMYTVPFATDEASRIVLLTQHYYRASGLAATSTLDLLLKPDPKLIAMLQALSTAAPSNKIRGTYRCSECNSFYAGGAPGVSNVYGAGLWAIDFLFTNAQYGSSGVNFHGGGDGPSYTPIADDNGVVVEARPVFYGMLLFSLSGTGPMASTNLTGVAGINFTAYAVLPADGSVNVVLVNKEASTAVHASVDLGKAVTSAKITRLEGPALDATTCITLGGTTVSPAGTWTPGPVETATVSGQTAVVDVAPASAVLVHATP